MRKLENQEPKLKINSSALAQDCYIRFLCHKNSRFNGRQDYIVRFALVRGNEYVCIMKKIKTTNIYWMLLVTWINKTTVNMKHRNLYHKKVTIVIVYSHSLAGCEKHLCYLSCHRMVNSRMVNFATLHEEKVMKKKEGMLEATSVLANTQQYGHDICVTPYSRRHINVRKFSQNTSKDASPCLWDMISTQNRQ